MCKNTLIDVFLLRKIVNKENALFMFYLYLSGVLGVEEDIYMTVCLYKGWRTNKEVSVYNTRSKEWRPLYQINGGDIIMA